MKIPQIRILSLSHPHEPERQWRTATFLRAAAEHRPEEPRRWLDEYWSRLRGGFGWDTVTPAKEPRS